MNVFELFGTVGLKGAGGVEQSLTKLEQRAAKVQKGMRVMGAAFTAVGAAGLAIIQSTKKINAALSVTAVNLGVTTKEMRALTLATTNVTFPIGEVTATFDLLARAGIKDQKVLKDTATSFDALGDALGMSASQVTDVMVPAMKTFGLSAEEIVSKTDAMAFMVRNSTISLEDFNTMVGYTSQDMVRAGLTIDDMAAAMMFMSDNGVEPGKVMLREWNKAVTQSEKEGIALTEALGMTSDELEIYKGKLEGATGLVQKLGDLQNKQFTIMDKLKSGWERLTLRASGFLEPLEPVLAGMTAMGPLMMALSTSAGTGAVKWALHTAALVAQKVAMVASAIAIHAVTAAQWLWNIAMTANPIGLIIVGIAALIAIGILVWKNWDKIAAFFKVIWENIKVAFISAKDFIIGGWQKMLDFFKTIPEKIGQAFKAIKDIILAPFRAAWALIGKGINSLISMLNKIHIKIPSWIPIIGGKEFGVNIKPVTLPKFAQGAMLNEPTLLSSLRTGRPMGIAGEAGPERLLGVAETRGGGNITNNFNGPWFIREEVDIQKIARELYRLQQGKARALGSLL